MSTLARAGRLRGALVAAIGVAAVGAGSVLTAQAPSGQPDPVAVTGSPGPRSSVVCPDLGASGVASVAVLRLSGDQQPARELRLGDASASAEDGVLDVAAEALADALPVATTDPATADLSGTVALTRPRTSATPCVVPGPRAWFTGVGAEIDHAATLELVNPETGPAVVRIRVLGPDGPVETVDLREVSVPPGERVVLDLAEHAPAVGEAALEVRTSRGRVAAFLTDRVGTVGAGRPAVELIGSQATPRRNVVLGGLPGRADSHVLVVANPGEVEALGNLAVAGPDGTFTPDEGSELRVPPGGTVAVDLTDAVGAAAAAVRVSADAPVTAVVRSRVGADMAYAGPVRPLGPASGVVLPRDGAAIVQLTSDRAEREVVVEPYAADGRALEPTTVTVPLAGTVTVEVPGRARSVVVRGGGSGVRGAVVLRAESGVAVLPLRPGAARGRPPVVVPLVR